MTLPFDAACCRKPGWENYLSKEKVKIRKVVSNDERLFSLSSVTSPASRNEERKKTAHLSGRKPSKRAPAKKKSKENTSDESASQNVSEGTEPLPHLEEETNDFEAI